MNSQSTPELRRVYNRSYYLKHREERREKKYKQNREYDLAHREEKKAYSRIYYLNNREKLLDYQKQYCAAHPDEVKTSQRRWRSGNAEAIRERNKRWARNNREKTHIYRKRHDDLKAKSPGTGYTTSQHISWRSEMWGGRCWICAKPAQAIDHVKPLSRGGSHWPANLRPICKSCNSSKKAEWNGVAHMTRPREGVPA